MLCVVAILLATSAEDDVLALNASAPISPLTSATPTNEDGTSSPTRSLSDTLASVARPSLTKRNTCGTIYLVSTLSDPDKDALIKCVCGMYRTHLMGSSRTDAAHAPLNSLVSRARESGTGDNGSGSKGVSVAANKIEN